MSPSPRPVSVSSGDEAVIKKTEFAKKMEAQSQSPSKRSAVKPAARQTRPAHHSCPRRRPTGDPRTQTHCIFSSVHLYLSVCLFSSFVHHNKTLPCFIAFLFFFVFFRHKIMFFCLSSLLLLFLLPFCTVLCALTSHPSIHPSPVCR